MVAPPGLIFIYRLAFPQIIVLITTYGALASVEGRLPDFSSLSTWIYLICAFFARPLLILVNSWYTERSDDRKAVELGAVQPPAVVGSSNELRSAIMRSFSHGYTGDCFFEWTKRYGYTYRMKIYGEKRIMTIEPEHIKAILATQFDNFEKGPVVFEQFHSLLGLGVFNSDGDRWKTHRNMTRPFFNRNRISDFDNFERHAEDTIAMIKARLAEGYPVDFQDVVARFTLDSATEFLFGKDVESLGANLPYPDGSALANDLSILNHPSNVFVRAFMQGQIQTAFRARFGKMWPLKEIWSDEVLPHRRQVDKFVNPILEERQRQHLATSAWTEKIGNDEEEETFLDHLIKHTADNQVIKDELVNILVAGRDTTASLLTFCIYVLTERPDITERLRSEILEKVGPNARPTYEIISEMKFLRAFINETLRLYPAVPFNARTTKNPVVFPPTETQPAYFVPAGVKCQYSVFLMHRRADLWGPDVLNFDPDRFLDERLHKYLTPNPFIFLPFNAGPRICLGQQFAYNETSYFLIKFLQAFTDFQIAWDKQPECSKPPVDWQPVPGTTKGRDKVLHASHLTMNIKEALWVRMKDAGIL
ncbi:cytochrome P450 monooxygenase pc-2 [Lentinula raphanica]|uniref:Cytochrome P450 monooxygenase pc-2 n=1 Tax=Lentinula raphanica TaxID=153919 RepID=A0AA38PGX9_9AGAR|nr:cytochrome P450 monooxygenase pc-2 [Lentinula raphanica]